MLDYGKELPLCTRCIKIYLNVAPSNEPSRNKKTYCSDTNLRLQTHKGVAKEATNFHELIYSLQFHPLNLIPKRGKNAASNKPAKNQGELGVGGGSEREDPEINGACAEDMAPFLEQLQGGEGGDLHEVSGIQHRIKPEEKLDTLWEDEASKLGSGLLCA